MYVSLFFYKIYRKMKKFNLFKIAILAFSLALVSCDGENENLKSYSGVAVYGYNITASNLPVSNSEPSIALIEVGASDKSSVDRAISVVVDPSSTATPDQYTIDASSLVIPANEHIAKVRVTANYDNIADDTVETLVLNLVVDGIILDGKDVHTLSMFRFCPTDLEGSYSVTTTYGAHDFLATFPTNTQTVDISTAAGVNMYSVTDFSGGLYGPGGPYDVNYGTGAVSQAGNRDLVFAVNCGVISWSNQSDPWGAIIASGTNIYNPTTGVITISWECLRYGENGVSVYTPL